MSHEVALTGWGRTTQAWGGVKFPGIFIVSQRTKCQPKLEPSQQGETVSNARSIAQQRQKFTSGRTNPEATKTKLPSF